MVHISATTLIWLVRASLWAYLKVLDLVFNLEEYPDDPRSIMNYVPIFYHSDFVIFVIILRSYFFFVSIIDFCTVTLHEDFSSMEFTVSAVGFITV